MRGKEAFIILFHKRTLTIKQVIAQFGVNYEGETVISKKTLHRYTSEMRKYISNFGSSGNQRLYTLKEVEVLRYIKRRITDNVSITSASKDAVSVFYEITYY